MCKSTFALTLSLLTTSMLPPAVMAQSAPPRPPVQGAVLWAYAEHASRLAVH